MWKLSVDGDRFSLLFKHKNEWLRLSFVWNFPPEANPETRIQGHIIYLIPGNTERGMKLIKGELANQLSIWAAQTQVIGGSGRQWRVYIRGNPAKELGSGGICLPPAHLPLVESCFQVHSLTHCDVSSYRAWRVEVNAKEVWTIKERGIHTQYTRTPEALPGTREMLNSQPGLRKPRIPGCSRTISAVLGSVLLSSLPVGFLWHTTPWNSGICLSLQDCPQAGPTGSF